MNKGWGVNTSIKKRSPSKEKSNQLSNYQSSRNNLKPTKTQNELRYKNNFKVNKKKKAKDDLEDIFPRK